MKILLIGEASNFHWTLAQGLRLLGHEVSVVSHGCSWMNNRRDVDIRRKGYGTVDSMMYLAKILSHLPSWKDFDVVQVASPIFFQLKPDKNLYIFRQLKRQNKKIFLQALSTDHYYVKTCFDGCTFRYSDFFVGSKPLSRPNYNREREAYLSGPNMEPNIAIAQECNGIAACLYEYYVSYVKEYADKLAYIPIPVNLDENPMRKLPDRYDVLRFFIGIQRERSVLKGTDIMYDVLQELARKYKYECEVTAVENVPLADYNKMMYQSDVMVDQLYSYTPATNALLAMAKGLVAVSGAEPEFYDFIGDADLRPIVNVVPDWQSIYNTLERLILQRETIPVLARESRAFVERYHDYRHVAAQYVDFWNRH